MRKVLWKLRGHLDPGCSASGRAHLKVLYFGTPVVLVGSRNPDGTPDLAPMSSAWWLGQSCMLGLGNSAQTTANLLRERQCVLNLARRRWWTPSTGSR